MNSVWFWLLLGNIHKLFPNLKQTLSSSGVKIFAILVVSVPGRGYNYLPENCLGSKKRQRFGPLAFIRDCVYLF